MESKLYRILLKPRYLYGVPATLAVFLFIISMFIGIYTEEFFTWLIIVYPVIHMAIWLLLDENPNTLKNIVAAIRCRFRNKRNKDLGGVYYSPIHYN